MNQIRIGTRGSQLALAQANWVKAALEKADAGCTCELVVIKTSGDEISGRGSPHPNPLPEGEGGKEVAGKGLFVKELEEALLEDRIDLAVHSAKDMETQLPKGLTLAAIPAREDPRDALVARQRVTFQTLPAGAKVGVSSLRRVAQLKRIRTDLEYLPIRGNVDTRLRKCEQGEVEALVLAACGLNRLGLAEWIRETLDPRQILPAPAQGALGIEMRQGREELKPFVQTLDHAPTHLEVRAERALLKALGGNCRVPVGALARAEDGKITLAAVVLSPDGRKAIRRELSGPWKAVDRLGEELASHLRAAGADRLLYGAWAQR